jgi:methylenetetrahydrofolate dehydrogenase (NADP+) / methenyltetrahydrofolate cyclohydrolase
MLDGRPVARELKQRALDELHRFRNAYGITPALAIVLVGSDPSAHAYRDAIVRTSRGAEIGVEVIELAGDIDQTVLDGVIDELNERMEIHGVLVLQPLPPHLSRIDVADRLDPLKDIDGITTANAGRLFHNDRDVLAPSTAAGGMALLKHYQIPIAGQYAVVVGRSPVVGRPMAAMLLAENATVTNCHSRTRDLARFTRDADILVSAVGKPGSIRGDMVKRGAVIVDFAVNFVDNRMVGDTDIESVAGVAGYITPVPGGTGRVTTAVLLRNTIKAATLQLARSARQPVVPVG